MHRIVCRFETAELLAGAVASPDRELPVARSASAAPASDRSPSSRRDGGARGAADGEWVLVIVEVAANGRATAAAARVRRHGDTAALVFEPRDWSRVQRFARACEEAAPTTARSPGRPRSSAPPRSSARKRGEAGARVLLVDDDVEVRDVVTAILEAVGLKVGAAHTGEEGLSMLARGGFDLVVLDWTLPGMSGLETCRAVRARWARLPVLFLTANAAPQDVVDAFAGGADDYVVKPFRAPELGARIFGLLRRASGVT